MTVGDALSEGDGLPDGDALSPGDAAGGGDSDDVGDGTSDGEANPLAAGDAATVTDGDSDGAGSLDWFDFPQPASANTKISAIKEAMTRNVRIGPPARSRFADDFRRTARHLSVIPLRTCRASLRGTTELLEPNRA
ncbi:MAG TPA: hypothetical protein VGU66_01420 [Candidatus Elarobacter sp.]|nr:hypothetical protein [Candidatus Elarobacter sp.]